MLQSRPADLFRVATGRYTLSSVSIAAGSVVLLAVASYSSSEPEEILEETSLLLDFHDHACGHLACAILFS